MIWNTTYYEVYEHLENYRYSKMVVQLSIIVYKLWFQLTRNPQMVLSYRANDPN